MLRGGLVYSGSAASSQANSGALGVNVAGAFTAGGSPMTASTTGHASWTWKAVVESDEARAWTAGVTVGRADDAIHQTPNAFGSLEFENTGAYTEALAGLNTGAWFVARGNGSARYTDITAAPFYQRQLLKSGNLVVNAGIRADYQSGYGAILSPRLSAAMQWRKFVFRSGGGLFAQNLPDGVLLAVMERDGLRLQEFMAQGVSYADYAWAPLAARNTIRSQLAPGIVRPRQFMQRSSIERPMGSFDAGVEYSLTRGEHLLGSRRLPTEAGWVDLLESDRDSVMNRLHSQLSYKLKSQRLVASYDWTDSRDDTDGPFSFPADQNHIGAEWARSAGVRGIISQPPRSFVCPPMSSPALPNRGTVPRHTISPRGWMRRRTAFTRTAAEGRATAATGRGLMRCLSTDRGALRCRTFRRGRGGGSSCA